MIEMIFSEKDCSNSLVTSDVKFKFPLQKPMWCPICNAFEDGQNLDRHLFNTEVSSIKIAVISYRCTHCSKIYTVTYKIDLNNKHAVFSQMFPNKKLVFEDELIQKISPRFIDMYNQSLTAESNQDFDLAAMGYRASLEILVKDFAINALNEECDTVISKSLCDVIGKYLGSEELVKTADVVRILGNDAAHYMRKYPEHDFNILKQYMQIFIDLVRVKLMILNPPVERK